MSKQELIPNLFRTEYQKIVSVLIYLFGVEHIEIAEDIVSDTFLSATELWDKKGVPENPIGWLYTVAKNKTRNYIKRHQVFEQKLVAALKTNETASKEIEIDLSVKNIADSQLAMIFTICDPIISADSQVTLALNLLCGFGIQEIADAFLTNKEVIYKRINRAKEKLKEAKIKIEPPSLSQIASRLDNVLKTLYLLYSEGYYSTSQNIPLRKDLCEEAMRLALLLAGNNATNTPQVNALLALMCFHSSRFDARLSDAGDAILYLDQDESLWNQELINTGLYFLDRSSNGNHLSKYHCEAGIAYWHTRKADSPEKWENILRLYDQLLAIEYSPTAALNRIFALSKIKGKQKAIVEAEKLNFTDNVFFYSLLGNLYTNINDGKAISSYQIALNRSASNSDKATIQKNIELLKIKMAN
ncbi:RNA polymerase sigma-70 factor, ECF subfamily [Mucilaginibacter gossypiicola]|uniref:RNA polymerase sigma-70 factor, ECF subfamily n=1 Tax=Mucilaginibacter gossypiicola TaxID=551995 RepID=A0A1H8BBX0_9SPHI|nr:sigma-70 family RNA polymerase sigma factor [Mucilaginibacter gossypiicola]SEM80236.1 RNA polymerase sigma-70 factor, ECF subfamily [Mucilaginibacter gossypiicola]